MTKASTFHEKLNRDKEGALSVETWEFFLCTEDYRKGNMICKGI